MGSSPVGERVKAERPAWHEELTKYERPDTRMALGQLATSILPFLGLWALMAVLVSKGYPYWITLALAVPAAGFLIRIFIIFHDCGHGSAAHRSCNVVGRSVQEDPRRVSGQGPSAPGRGCDLGAEAFGFP